MFEEKVIERVKTELSEISESDLEESYRGTLNDCSRVLEEVDPTAYRCGLADFIDSECSDGRICEIDGEYYNADEVEEIESEIEDEEGQEDN